jgi:hypothetical protein
MRLPLSLYRCSANGHRFKAPDLLGGYGTRVLRSRTVGSIACVDAIQDPVFQELDRLFSDVPEFVRLAGDQRIKALWAVFGRTCDPDPSGSAYVVDGEPCCPDCGDCGVQFVESVEPPEYIEVDVPSVTHRNWDSLEPTAREAAVQAYLVEYLHPQPLWP